MMMTIWRTKKMKSNFSDTKTIQIKIRSETENDFTAIRRVNDLAFGRPEEGRLVDNLRLLPEYEARLSLVAELEGKIVGHVLFTPIYIHAEDGEEYPCLSLGPIAVIPDYQKQGTGGQLIRAGHLTALELDYTAVLLLGHPSYYPRFGYQPADKWELTNPWQINGEPWMAIELVESALTGKAGKAIYPDAFNEAT
jgi:putative acetyltransferase